MSLVFTCHSKIKSPYLSIDFSGGLYNSQDLFKIFLEQIKNKFEV